MVFSIFLRRCIDRVAEWLVPPGRSAGDGPSPVEWLILGLGNPGPEYEPTRHNIGYRVVGELARRHGADAWVDCGDFLECSAMIMSRPVVLVHPLTFMNRSGDAAVAARQRHLDAGSNLLVIVDDVDLPIGRLRLKASGGPGTHNGLRDIVKALGPGFARLRVGIRGDAPGGDLADYVLSPFDEGESELVEESIDRAVDGVETIVVNGLDHAMGEINRRSVPPPPSP